MARQEVRSPVADSGSPISNNNSARPFNDDMAWVLPLFNGTETGKSTFEQTSNPDTLMDSPPETWSLQISDEMNGIHGVNVEEPEKVFSGPNVASERSETSSDSQPGTSTGLTHTIRTFNTEPPLVKDSRSSEPAPNQGEDLCCPSSTITSEVLGKRSRGKAFFDTQLHGKTSRWETSGPKTTNSIPPGENQSPDSIPATAMRVEAHRCNTESINITNQDPIAQATGLNSGSHQGHSLNDANIAQTKSLRQLLQNGSQPGPNVTHQHQHTTSTNVPRNQSVQPESIPFNEHCQQVGHSMQIVYTQNCPPAIAKPSMPIHVDGQQTVPHASPPRIPETTHSVPQSMEYQATRQEAPLASMQVNPDTAMTPMAAPPCIDRQQITSTSVPVAQVNNKAGESAFPAAQQMAHQSTQQAAPTPMNQSFQQAADHVAGTPSYPDRRQKTHSQTLMANANHRTVGDPCRALESIPHQQALQETSAYMVIEPSNGGIPATSLNPSLETQHLQPTMIPALQNTFGVRDPMAQQVQTGISHPAALPCSNTLRSTETVPSASGEFTCTIPTNSTAASTQADPPLQTRMKNNYGLQNATNISSGSGSQNNLSAIRPHAISQELQQGARTMANEPQTGTIFKTKPTHVPEYQSTPYEPRVTTQAAHVTTNQIPLSQPEQSMKNPNPLPSMYPTVQGKMAFEAVQYHGGEQPQTPLYVQHPGSQHTPYSAYQTVSSSPYQGTPPMNLSYSVNICPQKGPAPSAAQTFNQRTQSLSASSLTASQGRSLGSINWSVDPPPYQTTQPPNLSAPNVQANQAGMAAAVASNGYTTARAQATTALQTANYYTTGNMQVPLSQPNKQPVSQLLMSPAENKTGFVAASTYADWNQSNPGKAPAVFTQNAQVPIYQAITSSIGQRESEMGNVAAPSSVYGQQNMLGSVSTNAIPNNLTSFDQIADSATFQDIQFATNPANQTNLAGMNNALRSNISNATGQSYRCLDTPALAAPSQNSFTGGFQNGQHAPQNRNISAINPDIRMKQGFAAAASNSNGTQHLAARHSGFNQAPAQLAQQTTSLNGVTMTKLKSQAGGATAAKPAPTNDRYQRCPNPSLNPIPQTTFPSYQRTQPPNQSMLLSTIGAPLFPEPQAGMAAANTAAHVGGIQGRSVLVQHAATQRNLLQTPGNFTSTTVQLAQTSGAPSTMAATQRNLLQTPRNFTSAMVQLAQTSGAPSTMAATQRNLLQTPGNFTSATVQLAPTSGAPNTMAATQRILLQTPRNFTSAMVQHAQTSGAPNTMAVTQRNVLQTPGNFTSTMVQLKQTPGAPSTMAAIPSGFNQQQSIPRRTSQGAQNLLPALLIGPVDPTNFGIKLGATGRPQQMIRPGVLTPITDLEKRVRSFGKFPEIFFIVPEIYRHSKSLAEKGFMLCRKNVIKCVDERCSMMHELPSVLNDDPSKVQWHKEGCRFSKAVAKTF